MKRTGGLAVLAVVAAMVAAGCGGGGGSTGQADSGWLLSNQKVDGSIGFTPLPLPGTYQNYTATSTGNVVFGLNANGTGYRAFMDFPLDGSAGGASVPAGASIQLATLSVFVGNVSLSSTVPTLSKGT